MLSNDEQRAVEYVLSPDFREGKIGYGDVAERIGVDPKTLYNWRQKPEFQEAIKEGQERSVDDRLLEKIMATGDPQAINIYYKRHGLFKDSVTEQQILRMTDEERERIEYEAHESYMRRVQE